MFDNSRADTMEMSEPTTSSSTSDRDQANAEAGAGGERSAGTELQFSATSRMTWLWAPDADTAARVRRYGRPAYLRGKELPLVTDIDIGVDAYEACQALAKAGFTFTWHESVHLLNRDGWAAELPGMPTAGTR